MGLPYLAKAVVSNLRLTRQPLEPVLFMLKEDEDLRDFSFAVELDQLDNNFCTFVTANYIHFTPEFIYG